MTSGRSPLPCAYRSNDRHDELLQLAAERPLREAGEALNLALLALEGPGEDEERGVKARQHKAVAARGFLIEAATALGRAHVYLPTVRSYSIPVIMAVEPDIDTELGRLHQLATRLLWYNHALLPARGQSQPLRPEDEAQLAVLVRDLARTARIDRAMKYAWLTIAVGLAGLTTTLGLGAALLELVVLLMLGAALQLGQAIWPGTPQRG
jgi:hypothetical protein